MEALDLEPMRWTRQEYERLGELGVFDDKPRVELIEGQIVTLSPQGSDHSKAIARLTTLLVRLFSETHYVRVQCPLNSGLDSQPEPDFCILRQQLMDEIDHHPESADLVLEVSESSLARDRKKARLYAACLIPEYWIVNLKQQRLEVYRDPLEDGYGQTRIYRLEEEIEPVAWPGLKLKVSSLFHL